MKKGLILAAMFILALAAAHAEFAFGLRGGANLANVSYGDGQVQDGETGFNVGLISQLDLGSGFILQGDLIYTQKGFQDPGLLDTTEYFALNYVELPLALKFDLKLKAFRGVSLQPCLGVSLSYPIDGEYTWSDNVDNLVPDIVNDLRDEMTDLTLGLEAGLDLALNRSVMLGVRYNLGQTDAFLEDFNRDGYRNTNLMVNLGFMID